MKLFELFATLSLDTREFERNMRSATKQGSGFAGTMERQLTAGTVALGNLAADAAKSVAGAVTGIIRDAFSLTGELEQNIGGAEAVFKDFSDNIQANAQTAYKTAGLSVSDYLAEANKMGGLLQGMGFTVGESFDMSVQWMQRASDVASILGIDVSSAMQAIQGAAKGNFSMMDNLAVAMNDTALKAYALENGLIQTDKEWAKLGQQQKIAAAFAMFMDKTSYAAGNYAKENDTLAGSMTTLSAAWENLLSGAGDPEAFGDVVSSAVSVIVEKAAEIFPRLVEAAVEVFKSLVAAIEEYGPKWAELLLDAGAQMIASLYNGITGGDITPEQVKQKINEVITGISDAWNTVVETVTGAYNAVSDFFNITIPQAWTDMVTSIETWWNDHVVGPIQTAINTLNQWLGIDANKTATLTVKTNYEKPENMPVEEWNLRVATGELDGFATGLDYVPYNNYVARLHEGEAVLTKAEASAWRRGDEQGGSVGIDYGQLGQAVAAAMAGMSVQMDGQAVGVLVTGAVSREMGRRVKARQYTG